MCKEGIALRAPFTGIVANTNCMAWAVDIGCQGQSVQKRGQARLPEPCCRKASSGPVIRNASITGKADFFFSRR